MDGMRSAAKAAKGLEKLYKRTQVVLTKIHEIKLKEKSDW